MSVKHVVLIGLLGCLFVACDSKRGGGGGGDDPASFCQAQCDCIMCDDTTLNACQTQFDADRSQADSLGCGAEFDDLANCAAADSTCTDGVFMQGSCPAETDAFVTCLGGGNCGADGMCNPACGATDPDCTSMCTADGFCDPACAPGLDPDCGGTCTADGFCDPACAPGLDPDCGGGCDGLGGCDFTPGGCGDCAVNGGVCSTQYANCVNNPDCINYNNCAANCPAGDQVCLDNCATSFPTGAQIFDQLALCIICDACFISCGSDPACP
jgi:hypothetical protein